MRKIFITGGTGFFGKSMLDYRLRHPEVAKDEWTILSRDPGKFAKHHAALVNQPGIRFCQGDVRTFDFDTEKYDAVIHAATEAVTTLSDEDMTSVLLEGTRHVLDFAKACEASKFMLTSSGAVYGPQTSAVVEEATCNPVTAYGQGKLLAERMCVASGLHVLLPRCFAFVGPYLNRCTHFAIGNFIQNCLEGAQIVIKGDGAPIRSYMYADDLVEWLFAILDRGESGRVYNIGSDEEVSIRDLAVKVRDVLGSSSEIKILGSYVPGVADYYVPDVKRAKDELGVVLRCSLADSILKSSI